MSATGSTITCSGLFIISGTVGACRVAVGQNGASMFACGFSSRHGCATRISIGDRRVREYVRRLHAGGHGVCDLKIVRGGFRLSVTGLCIRRSFVFFVFSLGGGSCVSCSVRFIGYFRHSRGGDGGTVRRRAAVRPVCRGSFSAGVGNGDQGQLVLNFSGFAVPSSGMFRVRVCRQGNKQRVGLTILGRCVLSTRPLCGPRP